ncbi:MAG: hypothetical protein LBQ14_01295 [Treponema sp.]|nr:hypothetical protein [Treponema sp.]
MITPMSPGILKYYIRASEWNTKGLTYPKVKIDITYIDEPERPAVCNISFIQHKEIPRELSSAWFIADGVQLPLKDFQVLVVSLKQKTLRITSNLPENNFKTLLNASVVSFFCVLDGVEYQCEPPKWFYAAKNEIAEGLAYFQ